jgi:opacity protein-like surface antigen
MNEKYQMSILSVLSFSLLAVSTLADTDQRITVSGYGVIGYHQYNWEMDPDRRARFDIERFVITPRYQVNQKIRFESDIEFEHGGTGATMELDKFEEFGEFEMEIEKKGARSF